MHSTTYGITCWAVLLFFLGKFLGPLVVFVLCRCHAPPHAWAGWEGGGVPGGCPCPAVNGSLIYSLKYCFANRCGVLWCVSLLCWLCPAAVAAAVGHIQRLCIVYTSIWCPSCCCCVLWLCCCCVLSCCLCRRFYDCCWLCCCWLLYGRLEGKQQPIQTL